MDVHRDEDTVEELGRNAAQPLTDNLKADVHQSGRVEVASISHAGRVRSKNEDSFVIMRKSRSVEVISSSLPATAFPARGDIQTWLLAVADGLGGHASGEIASATAIRTIVAVSQEIGNWITRAETEQQWRELCEQVEQHAEAIQRELSQMAEKDKRLAGMATTIAAVYLMPTHALALNVGDSRCYLFRGRKLKQITRDHTLAQDMRQAGANEASTMHFRNLVTRSFNTDGMAVDVDMFHFALEPGDRLLVCSDGLTDMVSDRRIAETIDVAPSVDIACEQLTQLALEGGGRDNITAVLASV